MGKNCFKYFIFLIAFSVLIPSKVYAAACPATDGGAGDDDATVNGIITISSDKNWNAGDDSGVLDCSGLDIVVETGATLTLYPYNDGDFEYDDDYGADVRADNITIQNSAAISADNRGYGGANGRCGTAWGPGAGTGCAGAFNENNGGGAGYGGGGYGTGGPRYDSAFNPYRLGSGGGYGHKYTGLSEVGGDGGGSILLTVSGTLEVAGTLSARGQSRTGRGGGGSGGTIYTSSNTLVGNGTITATGGSNTSTGGAGGGGRVYLEVTDITDLFTGTVDVTGGQGEAEPGTALIVDSTNNNVYLRTSQTWGGGDENERSSPVYNNFTIQNNSTLYIVGENITSESSGQGVIINTVNFTLDSGSFINGDGYGYSGGTEDTNNGYGPGKGTGYDHGFGLKPGGGGGYGGKGGSGYVTNDGGDPYGSETAPMDIGSGGGRGEAYNGNQKNGAAGGSAIFINATGTVDISGDISMDGADPSGTTMGGAGSGGSIYLKGAIISGGGSLTAEGGSTAEGGGAGGGGRISFAYATKTFSGSTDVTTGDAGDAGLPGTVNNTGLPAVPVSLVQYASDGSTVISTGSTTDNTTVVMKVDMDDADASDTLTPEFEIRAVGTGFSDTATDTGDGVVYSGTTVTGSATVTGLTDTESYHWQVRLCDAGSSCSSWVSYGGNAESATDFQIVLNTAPSAPTSLGGASLIDASFSSDSTPTLAFSITDPDDSDQVNFTIQIDDDSDFSSPVVDYTSGNATEGSRTFTVGQAAGAGSYTTGSESQMLADGSYYWRVKAADDDAAASSYSTANSGGIAFKIDATSPPDIVLDSPSGNSYITSLRPSFKWKVTADDASGLSKYKVEINNGDTGDFSVDNISPTGSADVETSTYIVKYIGFGDGDDINNYIELTTKSSSDWGDTNNNGELREGKRTWKVIAYDNADNTSDTTTNFFLDTSSPSLSLSSINGEPFSSSLVTNSTSLSLQGRLTDSLSGDSDNGEVASGPTSIDITVEKEGFLSTYSTYLSGTVNLTDTYWTDNGEKIGDNASQVSDKYADFSYTPDTSLFQGNYKVIVTGRDTAGNSASITFTLTIGIVADILTVEELEEIIEDIQELEEDLSDEIIVTKPQEEKTPSSLSKFITKIVESVKKIYATYVSRIKSIWQATSKFVSSLAFIPEKSEPSECTFKAKLVYTFTLWFGSEPTKISNVKAMEIGPDYVVISWDTNQYSDSKVNYGDSYDYGKSIQESHLTKNHQVKITDLEGGTTYYYEVLSQGKTFSFDARHEFSTLVE